MEVGFKSRQELLRSIGKACFNPCFNGSWVQIQRRNNFRDRLS
ncbi:hypothetical protein MCHI_003514 [Candidatus Magnetoovum chiemensis]|nr:hypothetical protein MCHI_003514 [Candidatus Magnetoovum chiemensis]